MNIFQTLAVTRRFIEDLAAGSGTSIPLQIQAQAILDEIADIQSSQTLINIVLDNGAVMGERIRALRILGDIVTKDLQASL